MKRKSIFLALIFLISSLPLAAEKNYTSEKVVFLPQEFYVGDLVEMRVRIKTEPMLSVLKPEKFPASYWVKIENADVVSIEDGDWELRILLRSFATGIRTLPAIEFGDVVLRDIRIQTKSILEDDPRSFSLPAGQMLLPGTSYYIALIIGIIFLLPILLIIFWSKVKNGIIKYIYERRQRRPYKQMIGVLKNLQERQIDLTDSQFFTILIDELKKYLSARGRGYYTFATVRECSAMIIEDFSDIKESSNIIPYFTLADEVKFGDREVSAEMRGEILSGIRDTVELIDTHFFGGENNVGI